MKPTLLQYAAGWIPLLPVAAAVVSRRAAAPAFRWVVVWCVALVCADAFAMALGARGINNLWALYAFMPVITALILLALSFFHPTNAGRVALKAAIPPVVLVSVLLSLTIDDARQFSLVVAPFHSTVTLLASLWTFVALSFRADSAIHRNDWFWIIGGVMLYAAATTAIQPLSWYLLRERVDLLHAAFNIRAAIVLTSFAAITWGMLSQGTRLSSGGSSSPPSSPSSFSSVG